MVPFSLRAASFLLKFNIDGQGAVKNIYVFGRLFLL